MAQINLLKSGIHQPKWLIFLRIALGLLLIWKGINFIRDSEALSFLSGDKVDGLLKQDAIFIVVLAVITLLCGLFILIDLYSYMAAIVQLPVFIVKTLFIHTGHIERTGFQLMLTIIIPFLLMLLIAKQRQLRHQAKRKEI